MHFGLAHEPKDLFVPEMILIEGVMVASAQNRSGCQGIGNVEVRVPTALDVMDFRVNGGLVGTHADELYFGGRYPVGIQNVGKCVDGRMQVTATGIRLQVAARDTVFVAQRMVHGRIWTMSEIGAVKALFNNPRIPLVPLLRPIERR